MIPSRSHRRPLGSLLLAGLLLLTAAFSWGQEAAVPKASPRQPAAERSIEQRVSALDAYLSQQDSPGSLGVGAQAAPEEMSVPQNVHYAGTIAVVLVTLLLALAGLTLFHGGTASPRVLLTVFGKAVGCGAVVALLWWAFGYSLAFGTSLQSPFLGGTEFFFLKRMDASPNTDYAFFATQNLFAILQGKFAIFAAAIVVVAWARKVRFSTLLLFAAAWTLLVYCPLAHMVWGTTGLMNGLWNPLAKIRALDFAGGLVVHVCAGVSTFGFGYALGQRATWARPQEEPGNPPVILMGAALLWIGWFGLGDSDATSAGSLSVNTISAISGAFVWAVLEAIFQRRMPWRGLGLGAVCGLVAAAPALGFVTGTDAGIIGAVASGLAYFFTRRIHGPAGSASAVQVVSIHWFGGAVGVVFTGLLAKARVNPSLLTLDTVSTPAFIHAYAGAIQMLAALLTFFVAGFGSMLIAVSLRTLLRPRVTPVSQT